jgi:hypothetical protein
MEIDLKPTDEMAANAERGLALREKHGRGGTEVGVARARDIKNRKNLSPDTVRRMHSFFARHAVDKQGKGWEAGSEGYPSAGLVAHLLWGGDAGKAWADRKTKELDRKEDKTVNSKASHTVQDDGEKIKIERVELFMAFDPAIDDGEADPELKRFNNERLKSIVRATRAHMARGSFPQVVVMHEKNGDEPKSAVGRIPTINYEERGGIGYIVGDMEVNKPIFDSLIATNAFPRRSAEIWAESNHLSEVALLGRETPRRPLPDTHFAREGKKITCSKSNFDLAGVGGGLNTFVPAITKEEASMASKDYGAELEAMKCAIGELADMMKKKFGEDESEAKKDEMSAESETDMKYENAEDGVHIDIGSHEGAPDSIDLEEEEEAMPVVAARSTYALRSENARLKSRMERLEAEVRREKFSREIDILEQDGYRIPESQRDNLMTQLQASRDPVALLESWRSLFSRDPIGAKIDMSRAAMPKTVSGGDISSLVKEFAGKPEEFAKAINSRIKR